MFASLDTDVESSKDGKVISDLYSISFCPEGCGNPPTSCGVNKMKGCGRASSLKNTAEITWYKSVYLEETCRLLTFLSNCLTVLCILRIKYLLQLFLSFKGFCFPLLLSRVSSAPLKLGLEFKNRSPTQLKRYLRAPKLLNVMTFTKDGLFSILPREACIFTFVQSQ